MIDLVNCSLKGSRIANNLKNDIVGFSKKDLNNWTVNGEGISIEYTQVVMDNLISYVNAGPADVATAIKNKIIEDFGVTISDTIASAIATAWNTSWSVGKLPLYIVMRAYTSTYYEMMFILSNNAVIDTTGLHSTSNHSYANGSTLVTISNMSASTMRNNIEEVYGGFTYRTSDYAGGTTPKYYDTYANFQAQLPVFNGNITTDFTVEDGSYYLVKFYCDSPSGFTQGTGYDFVISSGNNAVRFNIDNTASQTKTMIEKFIQADGTTLNVKIDLEQFINSNGVTIDLGLFVIYKIMTI